MTIGFRFLSPFDQAWISTGMIAIVDVDVDVDSDGVGLWKRVQSMLCSWGVPESCVVFTQPAWLYRSVAV